MNCIKSFMFGIVVCGVVLLSACHSSKKMTGVNMMEPSEQLGISKNEGAAGKIVFLSFEVTETDSINETYSFKLLNKIFADGALKKSPYSEKVAIEKNYFYCEFTGANNERIEMIKAENPLQKIYEFPGDANNLGKVMIKTRTGQFNIRFQNNNNIKYLGIFKPGNNASDTTLKKIYYAAF